MKYKLVGNIYKQVVDVSEEEIKTYSLKEYKKALLHIPHLEAMLKVINLAIKGLNYYRAYEPIKRILFVLETEKMVLEAHYKNYKKIKDKKGKVNS